MMFFNTLLHYADFQQQTLLRLSNYQTIPLNCRLLHCNLTNNKTGLFPRPVSLESIVKNEKLRNKNRVLNLEFF